MKIIYTSSILLMVLFLNTPVYAQYNLLFLGDANRVSDSILVDYLIEEGYTLSIVEPNYFRSNYTVVDSFLMYDALYVSEVISSDRANNYALSGFPIPCVCTEGFVVRTNRWNLLTDDAAQFKQLPANEYTHDVKKMVFTDEDHYITNKYGAGNELVWTAAAEEDTIGGITGCMLGDVVYGAIPLAVYPNERMAGSGRQNR